MSWLTDNTEAQDLNNDWTAARTAPPPPEKTGLLKASGLGVMRGGVALARGTALAASTLFPHEDAPDDGSRIIPRKEDFFKFIDTRLNDAEKFWTPDPDSVGMAGQIIGGISELPLQLAGGPSLMAVSAGLNTGSKLVDQGIDPATAAISAVGAGTAAALMMKLPQAGKNLAQTAGLSALNPLIGAGQDMALKTGLEAGGYEEQAAAIDPLNPVSRAVDLTLGGVFGAMGYHANRVNARATATALENVATRANEYHDLIQKAGGETAIREQLPVETVDSLDTVKSYLKTLETNPLDKTVLDGVDRHLAALKSAIGSVTEGKPVDVAEQMKGVVEPDLKPLELQTLMDKWSARYGMTPDEEAGISALIQARAKALNVPVDKFVGKAFADVTNEPPPEGALMQDRPIVQPFYSKLLKEVDALPQEKWNPTDLMNKIRKTEGVKADEIAWTGLDEFLKGKQSVTRAEVRDYLYQNQVQVQEVVKSRNPALSREQFDQLSEQEQNALVDNPGTKFHTYSLPGGENYRELLLTLPGNAAYHSHHFDEPNILAHVRFNERTGPAGETILHLEEVQSDWHQQGRDKGYRLTDAERQKLDARRQEIESLHKPGEMPKAEIKQEWSDILKRLYADSNAVPDAPFAKTWHELALRRMLRYAAEQGFDRLTWTTGEQQAERYDISKKMDSVSYRKEGDQYAISGVDVHGQEHALGAFAKKQLADAVGKELSQKIINGEGTPDGRFMKLSGLDLKVGGEGMKGFYDRMLPQFLDKFGRKFGAKVEDVKINTLPDGDPYFDKDGVLLGFDSDLVTVHSLPITEAMRDSLLYEGQPLFQGGKGAVSFLRDSRAVIHALENPDFSTASHELAHVFARTLEPAEKMQFDKWLLNASRGKGDWSTADHETFARAFETYLAEGKAPTPELHGFFDKFKTWLVDIYRNIIGSPLETRLHPDAKAAFDNMLYREVLKKDVSPEARQIQDATAAHAPEMTEELHGLAGEPPAHLEPTTPSPSLTKEGSKVPARVMRDIALHTYEDPELIKRFLAEPTNVAGVLAQALEAEATQLKGAGSNTTGPSLVEYLRKMGINDDRGDLASMGIDEKLKPFAKKMLRPDGMALDKARESAVEKGYLPDGSTVADLLDKVGQELRGQPVYPVSGDIAIGPEWFQSILNLARRTGKGGDTAEVAAEALRKTAAGKFDKLSAAQQDLVLAALDHINHGIQSSAMEIDAHDLQVGDRFMEPDLTMRTVVAERAGKLIMDNGRPIDLNALMRIIGEVDQSGRPPEKGYDPLDYQVESLLKERGDFTLANGTDAAGNTIEVSAREFIDAAKNDLAASENRKHLYDRAAACMGMEF